MWTCEWCGRHMFDQDQHWSYLGYGKYCSQRCAEAVQEKEKADLEREKEAREQSYFKRNCRCCDWCGREYIPTSSSSDFCSDACYKAWAKDNMAKAEASNPLKSNIGITDQVLRWRYLSYNEIEFTYGNILNSGSTESGIIRIAVYSALDNTDQYVQKTLLGSYNFGTGLGVNQYFQGALLELLFQARHWLVNIVWVPLKNMKMIAGLSVAGFFQHPVLRRECIQIMAGLYILL